MRNNKLSSMARLGLAAVLTAFLGACAGEATYSTGVVYASPPPPRHVYVAPRDGYVWIDGHWAWNGAQWVWSQGYWERERPGYVYVAGRWEPRGHGYVWIRPSWRAHGTVHVRHNYRGRVIVRPHR